MNSQLVLALVLALVLLLVLGFVLVLVLDFELVEGSMGAPRGARTNTSRGEGRVPRTRARGTPWLRAGAVCSANWMTPGHFRASQGG